MEEFSYLKEKVQIRHAIKEMEGARYDDRRARERILSRVKAQEKRRRSLHGLRRIAAALLMMLTAGGVFYYLLQNNLQETPQVMAINDRQIEWILPNGERVLFDGIQQTVRLDMDGRLKVQEGEEEKIVTYALADNSQSATWHTVVVPVGAEYSVTLADGSVVWLNAGSTLRFPDTFSNDSRNVELKGEAFFRVAHDQQNPFHIAVAGSDIKVLGTSFNVCAYDDESTWSATLLEGSIGINNQLVMTPSQHYEVNRTTGEYTVKTVDTRLYTGWKEGRFYFSEYTFEKIVRKLERWYDFEMVYQDASIRGMRFTGIAYRDQPLDQVLSSLEQTADIRFETNGRVIAVDRKR